MNWWIECISWLTDGMCQLNDGWILFPAAAQPTSPQRTHPSHPCCATAMPSCHLMTLSKPWGVFKMFWLLASPLWPSRRWEHFASYETDNKQTNRTSCVPTEGLTQVGPCICCGVCDWLAHHEFCTGGDMFLSQHVVVVVNFLCKSILTTFQDKQKKKIFFNKKWRFSINYSCKVCLEVD